MPLSRRTFNSNKRYQTLVFAENTRPADFEMVELQDIQNDERRGMMRSLITTGAIGTGFTVVGTALSNAVQVLTGTYANDGERLLLPDIQHPLVGGIFVFNMPIATPVTDRTDLVYLEIWTEAVSATQDPDIEDPLLGPSATRERTVYQFRVAQGSLSIPALPSGHVGRGLASIIRRGGDPLIQAEDVTDIREIAALQSQFRPQNVITVAKSGGQFTDVQTALDSITGSAIDNPFMVVVEPGEYVSTIPLTLSNPYVQLVGRDPQTTVIKISPPSGSTQGVIVNATNIVINNMSLDYASGTLGNQTLISVQASAALMMEKCVIGKQFYDENTTNAFRGMNVAGSSTVEIEDCDIYGQNYSGVVVNVGTLTMTRCLLTGYLVDALVNTGVLTMENCDVLTNERSINSLNTMTSKECNFTTQNMKAAPGISTNCVVLGGVVTNTMVRCKVASSVNRADITDTTLDWDSVQFSPITFLTGSGSCKFVNCTLNGWSDIGVAASMTNCVINAQNFISGPLAGQVIGFYCSTGADVRIIGCTNSGDNFVYASNSSPYISSCRIRSNAGTIGLRMDNSRAIVTNCVFFQVTSAALCGSFATTAAITITQCHFQGPVTGPYPVQAISGGVGTIVYTGGTTLDPNITALITGTATQTDITA